MRMPWSRQVDELRTDLATVLQAARDAEDATARAESAAIQARVAAQEASRQLEVINAPEQGLLFRALRVWIAVTLILLGSSWLIIHGTEAFRNPDPASFGVGNVSLAIETSRPPAAETSPFTPETRFGITAQYDPYGGHAGYQLVFPQAYEGVKFVLLLRGGDFLEDVSGLSDAVTSVDNNQCHEPYQSSSSVAENCQIIHGIIKRSQAGGITPTCLLDRLSANDLKDSIVVELGGYAQIMSTVDWSHRIVSLPTLSGGTSNFSFDDWSGNALGGWYASGNQITCRTLLEPAGLTITDRSDEVQKNGRPYLWPDASSGSILVFSDRNSDAKGNTFIAFGGALAGLGVGLVPVATEAVADIGRERRRQRRLRQSQP